MEKRRTEKIIACIKLFFSQFLDSIPTPPNIKKKIDQKNVYGKTINENLLDLNVRGLAINGSYLYAGTYFNGVWRRLLSDMTSDGPDWILPEKLVLYQNYPNPFNPWTTIPLRSFKYKSCEIKDF
jgi:hypothetical protein